MKKPIDTRRTRDDINYPNRLYAISAANKEKVIGSEFCNVELDVDELPTPLNTYDKILKFCCSWSFVFISIALFSAFVIYSIIRYLL